jgi:hypothetical protein
MCILEYMYILYNVRDDLISQIFIATHMNISLTSPYLLLLSLDNYRGEESPFSHGLDLAAGKKVGGRLDAMLVVWVLLLHSELQIFIVIISIYFSGILFLLFFKILHRKQYW